MSLPPILRGEKVYLSALTKDDVPTVTEWYQNTEFMRLLDAIPARPKTPDYAANWIEKANDSANDFSFGVRVIDDGKLIGLIELEHINWAHGVSWLSIGIGDPDYWGKGFGSEAIELALKFAFHEINLHRVQLTVYSYNSRAIAAYEKLGFIKEGAFREFINRDGQRFDMILYGLLRPEWEARTRG